LIKKLQILGERFFVSLTKFSEEEGIPLHRIGTPEERAKAVILLLSNEAHSSTGKKIVVDGGQYMW